MADNDGNEGKQAGSKTEGTEDPKGQQSKDPQQGFDAERFVPKDRYDELRRENDALQAAQRAIDQTDPRRGQAAQRGNGPEPEDYIREYARQRGVTLEEAADWWESTNPIVERRLQQAVNEVVPVLSGMADKIAVMEILADPDYGELYKEHRKDIETLRTATVRKGGYLTPEAALHTVLAKKMLNDRKTGGGEESGEESGTSAVTSRARAQSASSVKGVRSAAPKEGPASAADVAKMTPKERAELLEAAADRGETF